MERVHHVLLPQLRLVVRLHQRPKEAHRGICPREVALGPIPNVARDRVHDVAGGALLVLEYLGVHGRHDAGRHVERLEAQVAEAAHHIRVRLSLLGCISGAVGGDADALVDEGGALVLQLAALALVVHGHRARHEVVHDAQQQEEGSGAARELSLLQQHHQVSPGARQLRAMLHSLRHIAVREVQHGRLVHGGCLLGVGVHLCLQDRVDDEGHGAEEVAGVDGVKGVDHVHDDERDVLALLRGVAMLLPEEAGGVEELVGEFVRHRVEETRDLFLDLVLVQQLCLVRLPARKAPDVDEGTEEIREVCKEEVPHLHHRAHLLAGLLSRAEDADESAEDRERHVDHVRAAAARVLVLRRGNLGLITDKAVARNDAQALDDAYDIPAGLAVVGVLHTGENIAKTASDGGNDVGPIATEVRQRSAEELEPIRSDVVRGVLVQAHGDGGQEVGRLADARPARGPSWRRASRRSRGGCAAPAYLAGAWHLDNVRVCGTKDDDVGEEAEELHLEDEVALVHCAGEGAEDVLLDAEGDLGSGARVSHVREEEKEEGRGSALHHAVGVLELLFLDAVALATHESDGGCDKEVEVVVHLDHGREVLRLPDLNRLCLVEGEDVLRHLLLRGVAHEETNVALDDLLEAAEDVQHPPGVVGLLVDEPLAHNRVGEEHLQERVQQTIQLLHAVREPGTARQADHGLLVGQGVEHEEGVLSEEIVLAHVGGEAPEDAEAAAGLHAGNGVRGEEERGDCVRHTVGSHAEEALESLCGAVVVRRVRVMEDLPQDLHCLLAVCGLLHDVALGSGIEARVRLREELDEHLHAGSADPHVFHVAADAEHLQPGGQVVGLRCGLICARGQVDEKGSEEENGIGDNRDSQSMLLFGHIGAVQESEDVLVAETAELLLVQRNRLVHALPINLLPVGRAGRFVHVDLALHAELAENLPCQAKDGKYRLQVLLHSHHFQAFDHCA
mmetsp:Transcript_12924/g.51599  ORF Transcript_12924/g.51599 Transcript_12924/m.51599 type:complete len:960 (+) Transcript_12924:1187-4066(+)